jgi:hypothetical protein
MATRKITRKTSKTSVSKHTHKTPKTSTTDKTTSFDTWTPERREAIKRLAAAAADMPDDMSKMSREQRELFHAIADPDVEGGPEINFHLMSDKLRKTITRMILNDASEAREDTLADYVAKQYPELVGNPFAWSASQFNTDLALAAQCELTGDIYFGDELLFEILRSPTYWNARQSWMADAEKGDPYALVNFAWRVYYAGILSPKRKITGTRDQRAEHPASESNGERTAERDLALKVGELTLECIRLKDMLKAAGLPATK